MDNDNTKSRCTQLEMDKRIFAIQGWIIEGIQPGLIIRQILGNKWCTSYRHAERLLSKARKKWLELPEATIEEKRRLKISELQEYKRKMDPKFKTTPMGIRTLVFIDKEIILLEGLRKPVMVALTDADGNPAPISQPSQIVISVISNPDEIKVADNYVGE
jgi:hypothetical protein